MERATPTLLYDIAHPNPARIATKEPTQISPDSPWWTPNGRSPQHLGDIQETLLTYTGVTRQRDVGIYLAELQNGMPYTFLQTEQNGQRAPRYPIMPLSASSDHLPIPGVEAQLYSVYASACGPGGKRYMESQIGMKKRWPQGESSIFLAIDPLEGRYLYFTLTQKTSTNGVRIHASSKGFPADRSIRPTPLVSVTMDNRRNNQTVSLAFRSDGKLSTIADRQGNIIEVDNPQPLLQRLLRIAPRQELRLNTAQTLHNLMKNIKRKAPHNPISQLAWV